jgi:2,5-diketo-D-gluconate reductase B
LTLSNVRQRSPGSLEKESFMQPIVSANGATIPALGFGTFRMSGPDVLRIVPEALKIGFRHIDTAQVYGNEAEVGTAIQQSDIPRSDIFLTTKVWVDNYKEGAFSASVDESLQKLKTDYIDLLLLHWPGSPVPIAEQIERLNAVQQAGKVRHIGLSNFNTHQMDEAARLSAAPLVTNQVEYHPYLDQLKVLEDAERLGMSITAYYAMADGRVPRDPVLNDIGSHHGKTAAQVVLRWLIQQYGVVALTKTATQSRLAENFDIFDFVLSADEMKAIHLLARPDGRIVNPQGLAPVWDQAA